MGTLKVVNDSGAVVGEVEVSEKLAQVRVNPQLLHDVIVGYQRNRRRGTASTLTRGEVRASGKKPWRQKGTGRARAGSVASPIWRGGGVTFGPQPRDFRRLIPRGLRERALEAVFADKLREGQVVVVERIPDTGGKTKKMARWLTQIDAQRKPLIVLGEPGVDVVRAARNIAGAAVARVESLSAWVLMAHGKLVVAKDVFNKLQERLG
ncbi:MAG: 50S ribosomal protein L4 [Candidatus Aureabacteria bacterium]|nr:50S ribosomal protein L4 [Candidatus Auribacterota bacterium]